MDNTNKPCRAELIASGAVAIPKSCPRHGLYPCPAPAASASIDTPEFRNLLQDNRAEPNAAAKLNRLVAHIDQHVAAAVKAEADKYADLKDEYDERGIDIDTLTGDLRDRDATITRLRADFKNFHRSLCERFGYTHDDADWARDLVSLEEHIANRATPAPVSAAPAGDEQDSFEKGYSALLFAIKLIAQGHDDPQQFAKLILAGQEGGMFPAPAGDGIKIPDVDLTDGQRCTVGCMDAWAADDLQRVVADLKRVQRRYPKNLF
jgi:hypothetical protein